MPPWISKLSKSEGGAVLVLAVATLVAGRTWVLDSTAVLDQWDAMFSLVVIYHLQAALLPGGDLMAAPWASPLHHGTTQSDWLLAQAPRGSSARASR